MEQKKFLIIDGNSIMNRAFYGIRLLSTKDGLFTNAIYGFLNIYYMMLDKLKPDYVAVSFDISKPTFRHKIYEEYKGTRKSMPDELRVQMPVIKEVIKAMNVPILELEGYEADDILGTVAKVNTENNIFTYILTGDKDSLQLIAPSTNIVMPSNKMGKTEYTIYTEELLKETKNIRPSQVIDIKALMGDSSDNIPGVSGIGEKTAYSLIEAYDNLDNIYNNIDSIKTTPSVKVKLENGKDIAYISRGLATIDCNVPINIDYDHLILSDVNLPELTKLFTRLSFKKFLDKYTTTAEDGSSAPVGETKNSKDFYIGLNNIRYTYISSYNSFKENVYKKLNDAKSTGIIAYFKNIKEVDILNDTFCIYIDNTIYVMDLTKIDDLGTVLKDICLSKCSKVGYDIKPYIRYCFQNGVADFNGFNDDIKIAYYLLNSTDSNYTIENITYNILDINFPENEVKDAKAATKQTSMFDIIAENSDSNDEAITKRLANDLNDFEKKYLYTYLEGIKQINRLLNIAIEKMNLNNVYKEIEMPLIETLANMECTGMLIDKSRLKEFGNYLKGELVRLEAEIIQLAGQSFNINSHQQLGNILFDVLKLPTMKKTKTGYSTDKDVLDELVDKHPIVDKVLTYRSYSKLNSTYVEGLFSAIEDDGRIHTTFTQTVTSTGRLSSIEPNLQNIPVRTVIGSKIRECFIARDEYEMVDADYSQIELRILAHLSGDQTMIDAFNNNRDIHSITASQVFNVPLEEVTKELRFKAKAVNFGIVYGISDFGLAKNISSTRQQAKEYIEKYLEKYVKIKEFMDKAIEDGKENGYVYTMFGRMRKMDELKSGNKNTIAFGKRVAMNTPVQGTAADIIKLAMNRMYLRLKEGGFESRLIMQVHDELIIETKESEMEEVSKMLKEVMEGVCALKVKLDVDINKGKTWHDAK